MKRILLALFILFALMLATPSIAVGEEGSIDLSELSLAQLVDLNDQLNLAIWNSSEWQEVTVPRGIWKIGEDIPSGHWTLRATEGDDVYIRWAEELDQYEANTKKNIDYGILTSETSPKFGKENYERIRFDWKLVDGTYFESSGNVIFTPYEGKPAFNFK